jgi:hypothetical protein
MELPIFLYVHELFSPSFLLLHNCSFVFLKISLWLGISVYNTLASKICVKLLKPPKISDSNAQRFLSDLLTHP